MASALTTDVELIAACLSGDLTAWDLLITRYSGLIYALTLRMGLSRTDAEDVFQNVSLRLYQNLSTLRDVDRLSTWLSVTTRNECASFYRKRRGTSLESELPDPLRSMEKGKPLGASSAPGPEETALALELQFLVRECLHYLPPQCGQLLSLLYMEDPPCSYAEVADRMNMPIGSIGPRRARCLQQLEKHLKKFGY